VRCCRVPGVYFNSLGQPVDSAGRR
jgi:hypothetical protein